MQATKNSNSKIVLLATLIVFFSSLSTSANAVNKDERIIAAEIVSTGKMVRNSKKGKISYWISSKNRKINFELEPNNTLLKEHSKLTSNAETIVFKGSIPNLPKSWARFTERNGTLTGAFYDGTSLYLVEKVNKLKNSMKSGALRGKMPKGSDSLNATAIINLDDIEHDGTCALHQASVNSNFFYEDYVADLRQILATAVSREINITLVADTEYVSASSDATLDMISSLNIADGIFSEQLGVQLTLSATIELSDNDTLTSTDPIQLIKKFRDTSIPNPGLRHLFTGKDLNGSTVGIAYVGSLCFSSSVGITQRFGSITPIILAHELGHNFGAPHDNQGGSACSSTPSGFIMNPSVSGGLNQFSSCSIQQISPYIEQASNGFNACITELEVVSPPPVITSRANLVADVGEAYQYDSDNIVDVQNDESLSYLLDISPVGMEIDSKGLINWIPTAEQTGINPVQITVQNSNGQDTQYFEVEVQSDFINFDEVAFSSFATQDRYGNTNSSVSPFQLELTGNNWKTINFNYTVTANTILEFEFKSEGEAEIQGIGFETDNSISRETTFNVYGNQNWGVRSHRYIGNGDLQKFSVPMGQFFQGDFNQLIFVMDNDAGLIGTNAVFKNVRVYEETTSVVNPNFLDLSSLTFFTDMPRQDLAGTVTLTDAGKGVELIGNRWRKVLLDNVVVTPTTILEFEFKSTKIGDIHGLGFLPGTSVDRTLSFQLFGTQNWGIDDFTYTGDGEFQSFYIPVGKYFTQDSVELVFIMDHDVSNPNANSTFRNIVIRDTANPN